MTFQDPVFYTYTTKSRLPRAYSDQISNRETALIIAIMPCVEHVALGIVRVIRLRRQLSFVVPYTFSPIFRTWTDFLEVYHELVS